MAMTETFEGLFAGFTAEQKKLVGDVLEALADSFERAADAVMAQAEANFMEALTALLADRGLESLIDQARKDAVQ